MELYVPGARRRSLAISPRVPFDSVTRSTVTGFFSGNLAQPESSGLALALVLNHTSCVVMYKCVNWNGVLAVAETFVRAAQPANAAQTASATPAVEVNRVIWTM